MNIVICGAGEIGSHAAEVLADRGTNITVIDLNSERLGAIEESMDVATLQGNCAQADVLTEAGCAQADLVLAATDADEVNLLAASLARGIGASRSIARVHHGAFFHHRGLDYQRHLGIDRLICPEYATALAIARKLRNPGAVAIENFARGRIEMQELTAGAKGGAIGKRLMDVRLPAGTRLALIRRNKEAFIPEAKSVVVKDDKIILVGNAGAFEDARKLFRDEKGPRQRVVIMGGPPIAVWVCRSLRDRSFAIRLFERDRKRAEELAEKLPWVTVIQADPTDRNTFDEENLAQADAFVALLDNDEANIIGGVLAKIRGVATVITVVQKSKYLDLAYDIGVDTAFSTRHVASEEIDQLLDESALRHLGSLAAGSIDVFRVRIEAESGMSGKPLRELPLSPDWVLAAIQRDNQAFVPGADDTLQTGDVVLVVGRADRDETLRSLFCP